MKYTLHLFILVAIIAASSCKPSGKQAFDTDGPTKERTANSDSNGDTQGSGAEGQWSKPTETFRGTMNGMEIVFQHLNYTQFRLQAGTDTMEGELNTERGYKDDEDATVYIVDYKNPQGPRCHFVRKSDGTILMLGSTGNELVDGTFRKD